MINTNVSMLGKPRTRCRKDVIMKRVSNYGTKAKVQVHPSKFQCVK